MLPESGRVGVAVSGGADSVVLLQLLHRLATQFKAELLVLHVNHHLRGKESDADEQFVRELARCSGLECVVEHAEVDTSNIEEAARDARRAFFFRLLRERTVFRVALGHTLSDQAETVLFRLLRGTGLAGLAGMQMRDAAGLMRPLLTTTREEVRSWAQKEGIRWREDCSNEDLRFARNRLRNEFMPLLARHFNSNLEATLATTAFLAQAEEDYWNEAIRLVAAEITERTYLGSILNVSALNGLHPAVQRRVIRHTLTGVRGHLRSIDADHVEAILRLCRNEQGHNRVLVPGADALRSFDRLLVTTPGTLGGEKRHYQVEIRVGSVNHLPLHAGTLCVAAVNSEHINCANFKKDQDSSLEVAYLDGEALARHGSLHVRNWEPGDQILRPGHHSPEKLKSLFQEHRVLLWERRHWPVVMSGDEIAWVRGFGPAAAFQATEVNGSAIRIAYRAERPARAGVCESKATE
jgi:tRNA(Ile)-lysidine synthase